MASADGQSPPSFTRFYAAGVRTGTCSNNLQASAGGNASCSTGRRCLDACSLMTMATAAKRMRSTPGYGYEVTALGDSRGAMADIAVHRPALVLLDLQMPFVDGFELLGGSKRSRGRRFR